MLMKSSPRTPTNATGPTNCTRRIEALGKKAARRPLVAHDGKVIRDRDAFDRTVDKLLHRPERVPRPPPAARPGRLTSTRRNGSYAFFIATPPAETTALATTNGALDIQRLAIAALIDELPIAIEHNVWHVKNVGIEQ